MGIVRTRTSRITCQLYSHFNLFLFHFSVDAQDLGHLINFNKCLEKLYRLWDAVPHTVFWPFLNDYLHFKKVLLFTYSILQNYSMRLNYLNFKIARGEMMVYSDTEDHIRVTYGGSCNYLTCI